MGLKKKYPLVWYGPEGYICHNMRLIKNPPPLHIMFYPDANLTKPAKDIVNRNQTLFSSASASTSRVYDRGRERERERERNRAHGPAERTDGKEEQHRVQINHFPLKIQMSCKLHPPPGRKTQVARNKQPCVYTLYRSSGVDAVPGWGIELSKSTRNS